MRPIAFKGSGFTRPVALAGTSKLYPWSCSSVALEPRLRLVSSLLIQLPQGVTPPAQLRIVPVSVR